MNRLFQTLMLGWIFGSMWCWGGIAQAQSTNPTGRVGPVTSAPSPSGGQPFLLQNGPATSLGGNGRSETLVVPGGGIATATPNGNGTTTVTHTDGSVEVVNTPR